MFHLIRFLLRLSLWALAIYGGYKLFSDRIDIAELIKEKQQEIKSHMPAIEPDDSNNQEINQPIETEDEFIEEGIDEEMLEPKDPSLTEEESEIQEVETIPVKKTEPIEEEIKS